MPGIGGRMSTVIKAKISRLLDRAEDPGETLDYSYQRQLESLQNVKKGIADVVTANKAEAATLALQPCRQMRYERTGGGVKLIVLQRRRDELHDRQQAVLGNGRTVAQQEIQPGRATTEHLGE